MLRLTVVTPERPFLLEECLNVTLPGRLGEMQILPGHVALLAELRAGTITYQSKDKGLMRFMIGEGVVEVEGDRVNVLCDTARHKSEVDKDFEERLLQELKAKLDKKEMEEKIAFVQIEQCSARLSLFE